MQLNARDRRGEKLSPGCHFLEYRMYQRILVPFDGSTTSIKGLEEAVKLAKLSGAALRVVHVIEILDFVTGFEPYVAYAQDVLPNMKKAGEQILEQARACAAARGIAVETLLIENPGARVSDLIIEQVKAWSADIIVIGTHGRRGAARVLLGSDAEQIVRSAPVPVLLVRATEPALDAEVRTQDGLSAHTPSTAAAI
jgi:nucleotide-binding universal stress UspA family protein